MAKVDDDFTHDVFRFLPENIRDLDTAGVLERFLGGVQEVFESQQAKIEELDTLHNLDTIADAYLVHLKHHVGWTAELDSITEALSFDQLRKLIELSVPFWKRKGTEPGIRDALRLLTGRDVVIRNWFFYRWTVGVTRLWRLGVESDPYLTGGAYGARDQLLTIIFVSTETEPDKQLIRDLVNLHRPLREAVKVMYCDLVDDFGVSREKWTTFFGTDITYDDTRKLIEIPVSTIIQANTASALTWDETIWRNTAAFTVSTGGEITILFRRDVSTNYRYRARFGQDGSVELAEVAASTTVLASGNVGHTLPLGETTTFGVDLLIPRVGQLTISLRVHNEEVISYTVTSGVLDPGRWMISNSGLGALEVDNVIAYELPVHVDTIIGPGTVAAVPVASVPMPYDPFADYIGNEGLTEVGTLTPETLGYSGWTAAIYASGLLAPTGAVAETVIGVRLILPANLGVIQHIIGRDETYGTRLWISAAYSCMLFIENSSGITASSRSMGMAGLSPGDDVWIFIRYGIPFAATCGITVVEVGAVAITNQSHSLSGTDPDTIDNSHRLGTDNALGLPLTGNIQEVLAWNVRLSDAQFVDIADGTSRHSPVLGYFEP